MLSIFTRSAMKRSLSHSGGTKLSGFTLVELLVVVAIIAILAAVLLSAGSMALKAAQRAKAANMATQLQTACMGYYTEYSVYPVPTGTTTDYVIGDTAGGTDTGAIVDGPAWGILLCALSGNVSPYNGTTVAATTIANTRNIAFLTLKSSDIYSSTILAPSNPLSSGTSIYFNIAINSSYSGVLGTTVPSSSVMPNFATGTTSSLTLTGGTSTAGVAVWANCTGKTAATSCNANFWVHTY
jgi:prepilin-type N-terminal cleavage/methylation domain-containing protein